MYVVRIGGPAYKIGLGGGFSSSLDQDQSRNSFDYSAVQRGDPQMCNKLNRVIKICSYYILIINCGNYFLSTVTP